MTCLFLSSNPNTPVNSSFDLDPETRGFDQRTGTDVGNLRDFDRPTRPWSPETLPGLFLSGWLTSESGVWVLLTVGEESTLFTHGAEVQTVKKGPIMGPYTDTRLPPRREARRNRNPSPVMRCPLRFFQWGGPEDDRTSGPGQDLSRGGEESRLGILSGPSTHPVKYSTL